MDVYVLRLKFIKELEELAGSSYDGLKEIYNRLKCKEMYTPLQNLRNVRFDLFKQKMLKARREFVPKTPDTLLELGQLLMDYPPLRSFYKGQATADDGSVAQIFINDDMLAPLNKITEIFCDGTFKIRCKQPKCAQIFTLHFRKVDMGFPSIICMTSSMTTSMYDAIWKKLFEIIPDLQRNIQTIHMDFERAQIKSAKKHFPSPKRVSGLMKITDVLEKMMKSYAIDYGKVAKGGRIRSLNLPANERTLDLQIIQAEEDLAIERYTVREFLGYIASLRRLDVARTNLYYAQLQWCERNRVVGRPDPEEEEEEEEEEEIEEITQTDIQYIQENLIADSGPGGTFEIEVAERRARRTQMIRISQNMSDPNDNAPNQPSTEQQSIPAGRIGRARMNASVAPSANIEQNEAAPEQEQVSARRRGRPRRNVSVAPSENVVQNEAAGEQQQVPVRRRGRPRTSASAASSVNVEQNEAAGEQAPVPTRRRGRPRTDASAASSVNVDQNEPTGEQLPVPARRRGQQPHVNLIDALEASTDEENDDDPRITSTDHNSTDENIGAMDNIESIDINDILTTEESAFNASTMQAPSMLDQEMNEVGNERIENLDLQNQNDVRFGEQEANTSPIASALVLVNANAINTREAKNDDDSGIPRKKRRRNPRKKCQLLSCEAKFRVRKLDCGHRYCVPCIRNFISRFCPQCRKPIGNYLPPEHMGGERWELGEDQQLDREFAHQTTRERIDLINSTRRLGIDIEDLYQ
uniref:RING-type domain-containing protein n=1 Tax=Trichogramma kaykai TaxID=54128 RepID=A0ABD2WB78_9HYME